MKTIHLQYDGIEKTLDIDPMINLETFIYHVKSIFNIENETPVTLFNPLNNRFIVPMSTSTLFELQNNEVPTYHVNASGKGWGGCGCEGVWLWVRDEGVWVWVRDEG